MRNTILQMVMFVSIFACSNKQELTYNANENSFAKGSLFIIGGGNRGDSLMRQMLVAANWKQGDLITAITLPSGYGDSAYIWLNEDFRRLTGENCVKFDSAAITNFAKLDSLAQSKVIFISGGDQSVMMRLIANTPVKQIINKAYQNGALVGGTSAGASIMSQSMITGNGLVDTVYQSTYPVLWKNNIELIEGLGLLDSVIIDQHFVARSRYNRLISAVIENPFMVCVGIDEATAILVHNDSAVVVGESQVIVISAPQKLVKNDGKLLGAQNLRVSIYLPGDVFKIKN